jgi:hypothetical protein
MKHYFIIAAVLMSFMCFTAPVMVTAAEAAQTLTGTLSTDTDDDGVVVKATLTVGEATYNIVLDKVGKELAAKMSDKKVEVTAVASKKEVETKDEEDNTVKTTELWLTVSAFKPVAEAASEDTEE